jgi:phosphoglycolate phosphatase
VLFDLDGTLVDTRPGVRSAIAAAFAEVTGSAPPEDVDLSLPLEDMIRSAAPTAAPETRAQLSAAFRRHHDSTFWSVARPYPGAADCLYALGQAGVRLFVVTNKRTGAARRLLESLGLARYFEGVVGQPDGESPLSKPELAGRCLADAGLDPGRTVVVGDSNLDAAMATSWNMPFIAVTSGAGPLVRPTTDETRLEAATLAEAAATILPRSQGGSREP